MKSPFQTLRLVFACVFDIFITLDAQPADSKTNQVPSLKAVWPETNAPAISNAYIERNEQFVQRLHIILLRDVYVKRA